MSGPLKQRFRAWWEGYDLAELKRRIAARTGDEHKPPPQRPLPAIRPSPSPASPQVSDTSDWSPERLAASQFVWGQGSLAPRGLSQLRILCAHAGLGRRSCVLHLGAELGGVADALRDGIGCTVLGAETLRPVADASDGRVTFLRAADGPLLPDTDFILVDGIAERGEPLTTLLRNQSETLVPDGHVAVRSLVMMDDSQTASPRYREWAAAEPVRPRLRPIEALSRLVEDARLSIVAINDISADYASEVEQSWGGAIDRIRSLHRQPDGQVLIQQLLAEGERWLKRIELIREGAIGVRILIATRQDRKRR